MLASSIIVRALFDIRCAWCDPEFRGVQSHIVLKSEMGNRNHAVIPGRLARQLENENIEAEAVEPYYSPPAFSGL